VGFRNTRIGRLLPYCLLPIAYCLIILAVYRPNVRDFFVLDDYIWLHAASTPDVGQFVRDAFGFPQPTDFSTPTPFWRPLIDGYFLVAWRLFGLGPTAYHLVNLLMHAANAVLFAVLVWRLTGSRVVAFVTALLWCVSPVYDYAVVWISEATELLATFWYLATLVLYVAFLRGRAGRWWLYAGALLCTGLALLAKQSSATLPPVLVLLALVIAPPRSRRDLVRLGRDLLPFVAVTLVYALFLYRHDYRTSEEFGIYQVGPHVFGNVWDFLLRLAAPFTLPGEHEASWAARVGAAAFLVAGCGALVLRRPLLSVAFVWTLVALLPYAFFPAGTEARYLYLSAMPFTLFLVLLGRQAVALVSGVGKGHGDGRDESRPYRGRWVFGAVGAGALAVLVVLLGQETRERQVWLQAQSEAYRQFVLEVPSLCGPLPEGARIEVVGAPMLDLFGESTRMALNLYYPHGVHVRRVLASEPISTAGTCAVFYQDGAYVRDGET
jgi:hypothetical protein